MSHVWVTSSDGDLLRADQIRQLNTVEGLRAVLVGGNQFLLAEIDGRQECRAVARRLSAAIAAADVREEWAEITIVREGPDWTVEVETTPSARPRRAVGPQSATGSAAISR
jgi:hypothetical protein